MRPLLGFSFICFVFQITNSHLSQPNPFWSLLQLCPYALSVCVRNIHYLFSPTVSKYQNIEDVSHFTTQNIFEIIGIGLLPFSLAQNIILKNTFTSMPSSFLKRLFQSVIVLYERVNTHMLPWY